MKKWFINLIVSLVITILVGYLDRYTSILGYGFSDFEILALSFFIWIILNQFDILKQNGRKKD